MIIYKCLNSNAEVVSDSYPPESVFGDSAHDAVAFQLKGTYINAGGEDYGIENNDEEGGGEEDVERVVDLVHKFELQELPLGDKKGFTKYFKKYMGSEPMKKLDDAQKGAISNLFKAILAKFDEISVYIPTEAFDQACDDQDVHPVLEWWDGEDPKYIYFKCALGEERC